MRRGLFRLWVAASAVWLVAGAWLRNIVCEFNLPSYGNGPWCAYQAKDWALHAETTALLLGPPVVLGLLGWIAAGFSREGGKVR